MSEKNLEIKMSNPEELGLTNYLHKEGAIGAIVHIDPNGGTLFGELEDRVHVSPTTLSSRLDEGSEDDDTLPFPLFRQGRDPHDHGNAKRYFLTKRGKKIRSRLVDLDLDDRYIDFREAKRSLDAGRDELVESIRGSVIVDEAWPEHPEYQQDKQGWDPEPPK